MIPSWCWNERSIFSSVVHFQTIIKFVDSISLKQLAVFVKRNVWEDQDLANRVLLKEPTITGSAYLDAVELWIFPQLEESETCNFLWHQDDAQPRSYISARLFKYHCTQPMDWPQTASR
ncbi:hypothetical protein TNCV_4707971 [Trichonephila clavipes]|nr:hypothetical protein TNCV_4707971 [Trichonephila clavipes]